MACWNQDCMDNEYTADRECIEFFAFFRFFLCILIPGMTPWHVFIDQMIKSLAFIASDS